MKPPGSILIGPYRYQVEVDELANRRAAYETGNRSVFGSISHRTQDITLDPDQAETAMRDTLLHEVLHGIFNLTSVLEEAEEERVVGLLTPLLLDTLRRNPELVAWLLADEEET